VFTLNFANPKTLAPNRIPIGFFLISNWIFSAPQCLRIDLIAVDHVNPLILLRIRSRSIVAPTANGSIRPP
jgi:hypothetical protein